MKPWQRDELVIAFALYCQIPFGEVSARNPLIVKAAQKMGRTPASVSMKLGNLASLDPEITDKGKSGLTHASKMDKAVWDALQDDWEGQVVRAQRTLEAWFLESPSTKVDYFDLPDYTGRVREAPAEYRVQQDFFRNAVLANYAGQCCVTGLRERRLLVASHIVPWAKDEKNRLNPRNGLCLSALHDKAFDRGLMTITPDFKVKVSRAARLNPESEFDRVSLLKADGKEIALPDRFLPGKDFLAYHNANVFLA